MNRYEVTSKNRYELEAYLRKNEIKIWSSGIITLVPDLNRYYVIIVPEDEITALILSIEDFKVLHVDYAFDSANG